MERYTLGSTMASTPPATNAITPTSSPTPPSPPLPPPPSVYSVDVLHFLSFLYPALTNPLTLLQTRAITHSLFIPTYLSPLHPSSALSHMHHPTYPLHLTPRLPSLVSREGLRALARGLSPAILSSLIKASILSYDGGHTHSPDDYTPHLDDTPPSPDPLSHLDSSSSSYLTVSLDLFLPWMSPHLIPVAILAAYPFDHLRTLLQLHQHSYVALPSPTSPSDWQLVWRRESMWQLAKAVVREGGLPALWRGVWPSLVGQSALLYVAMRTVEEASAVMEAANEAGEDDPQSPSPPPDYEGQDGAVGFPLTLADRLAWLSWPYSPSSLAVLLSTYLLLHYPLHVLSLHLRAAPFAQPHVSVQPLTPPPHPPGSHHLQMVGGVQWTRGGAGGAVGVAEVVRRVVERDGWMGLWRGLSWSVYKVTLIGVGITAFSWWTAEWEEGDDDGGEE